MKKLIAGVICAAAVLALTGCTTYEENYPSQPQHYNRYDDDQPMSYHKATDTCYARDEKGRRWNASGRRPCHQALHKCRKWHEERGMNASNCWIGS